MLVLRDKDIVILHMPKCGGSSVRWAAVKKYGYRWSCEHAPLSALPKKFGGFRKIGFIRSPESWYLSKYYHARKSYRLRRQGLLTCMILSDYFTHNFEQTLHRMIDLKNFFDIKKNIDAYKTAVQYQVMNHYSCHHVYMHDDVNSITSEFFSTTLYQHWYKKVGLDRADKIYKMDTGSFYSFVYSELPGVVLQHRNRGVYNRNMSDRQKKIIDSTNDKRAIYDTYI